MGHVCIVDDDEAVRDSLAFFLEVCGYTVGCFASALAFLSSNYIDDCVCFLIDMHMPGMSGMELLEMLRGRGVETPAILISAAADASLRAQAKKLDVLTCLDKPVDSDTLLDAIGRASRAS